MFQPKTLGWEAFPGLAEWAQCNHKREVGRESQINGKMEAKIGEKERLKGAPWLALKVQDGAWVEECRPTSGSLEKARNRFTLKGSRRNAAPLTC